VNTKAKNNLKKKFVNLFGVFGYLFCSLQWLWAILLYFSLIANFALFIAPSSTGQPEPVVVTDPNTIISPGSNILMVIISIVIIVIIIAMTIYFLYKIPSTIVKTGEKIVHSGASNITPFILKAQHKAETKNNKLKLTPRLVVFIKIALVLLPVVLSYMSKFIKIQLVDLNIAMCASVCLACFSLMFFIFQYILCKVFKIKIQDLF